MATGIHKAFAAHVEVDTQQRSARTHYIQTMKGQLQRLAELKVCRYYLLLLLLLWLLTTRAFPLM